MVVGRKKFEQKLSIEISAKDIEAGHVLGTWKDSALDITDVQKVKKRKIDLTSSPALITSAAPEEGPKSQIVDVQLSQKRALRVEMLKHRFADTILRAEQHMLLLPGSKCDPMERKKLEKKHLEAKARLESQIRASEAASRMKAEAELKLRRQKEREAARNALDKVQKTVEFNDSVQATIELEFEKCFGSAFTAQFFGHPGSQDEVLNELEEGEISC